MIPSKGRCGSLPLLATVSLRETLRIGRLWALSEGEPNFMTISRTPLCLTVALLLLVACGDDVMATDSAVADATPDTGAADTGAIPHDGNLPDVPLPPTPTPWTPCTELSCPVDMICHASGICVIEVEGEPPGPSATCTPGAGGIPNWQCAGTDCDAIEAFEPVDGPGYEVYPMNGETETNRYRSYLRRDVRMLVQYATAMVDCQAAGWTDGNGGPLGLGDMSEADGAIPGTSLGMPGSPPGTHVNGLDIDTGYYQSGTANNRLGTICDHTDASGAEQYRCTSAPTTFDLWRTALFVGHMHVSPNLGRVVVDPAVGPPIESAIVALCTSGYLAGSVCTDTSIKYVGFGSEPLLFFNHHMFIATDAP